jgi:hypothetical protein
MKHLYRRTNLRQRTRRTQRGYFETLLSRSATRRKGLFGFALILVVGRLLVFAYPARAATSIFGQKEPVKVIVHLLDTNNQPLSGVTVDLVLNRYGDTIEEIQAGSCITDATGSCSITVDDPPRLRSGKIEGFIDLGTYGRQLIGWKGDTFETTLQLYPDGKLATAPAPLDAPYDGQTEQPTDAPLSTSTSTLRTTATASITVTALSSTVTSTPPTITATASAAVTFTPQPALPSLSASSTPISSSRPHEKSGWAWIGLGLVLFAGLGAAFAIYYHRQRNPRQPG